MLDLADGRPQHASAHRQQDHPQRQRRRRLEALMAVRMVVIRVLAAVMPGEQDQEIRNQIGKGVDGIRHQRLGARHHADRALRDGQHDIDGHADKGTAPAGLGAGDGVGAIG
ncbi:hypothetical protein D3C81_1506370 [compost metagenome]